MTDTTALITKVSQVQEGKPVKQFKKLVKSLIGIWSLGLSSNFTILSLYTIL